MDFASIPDQDDLNDPSILSPLPKSGWVRVIYGLFVVVLPAFSFWAIGWLKPKWQSGELDAYLALFLQPEASIIFFFLLAYSTICYILLLINPNRYSSFFLIRFGVYTAVLLALHYSLILIWYVFVDISSLAIFFLWLFPLYFPKVYGWAVRKWDARRVNIGLGILMVFIVVVSVIYHELELLAPLVIVLTLLVAAAPFWSFLMAIQGARWLYKNYEAKLNAQRGLGIVTWLAAYVVAWRYDILKMYELYAQLPTEPPNCYIATAAARGHPRFVHSRTLICSNGASIQVNSQMQILKCAELALMAVAPLVHVFIRKIYNVLGKYLAQTIRNPFVADIAYLLLKPFEWGARACLRITVPEIDLISKRLYKNQLVGE